MVPDLQSIHTRSSDWRTAGILDPTDARRFIGRLTDCGIDHVASTEGRQVRVSVRNTDLDEALDLRPDPASATAKGRRVHSNYHTYLRMLFAIPGGAVIGNVICLTFAVDSRLVPITASVMTTVLVEAFANVWSQRRPNSRR